jgi:hypothetical protein
MEEVNKKKVILGYDFKITVEKSRFVKEKKQLALSTLFDGGISKWSGLMEQALLSGHVIKEKDGASNVFKNSLTGEVLSEEETNKAEYWDPILADPNFKTFIQNEFKLTAKTGTMQVFKNE